MLCVGGDVERSLFGEILLRVEYCTIAVGTGRAGSPSETSRPDHPLPPKIILNVPSILTFSELERRLRGVYPIHYKVNFIFNGRAFHEADPVPHDCFESFTPCNEERDFYRPRIVLCINLAEPVVADITEAVIPVARQDSVASHSDNGDFDAERRRAANFRDITALFDVETELRRIGCEAYINQLLQAGYLQEGCFAELTEEALNSSGIHIPAAPRKRFLELCLRIKDGLEAKETKETKDGSRPPSRILAPRSPGRVKHFSEAAKAKMAYIQQAAGVERDLFEGPVTVRKMASDGVTLPRPAAGFCCGAHEQQLLASLSWVTEYSGGAASLDVLVDLAIRAVRKSGWGSLRRDELVAKMLDEANIAHPDLVKIEGWLVNPSSQHEERALFAQRRYQKEKFVATVVAYLDSVNPEFFDSYSLA